jgi:hypothetical protein
MDAADGRRNRQESGARRIGPARQAKKRYGVRIFFRTWWLRLVIDGDDLPRTQTCPSTKDLVKGPRGLARCPGGERVAEMNPVQTWNRLHRNGLLATVDGRSGGPLVYRRAGGGGRMAPSGTRAEVLSQRFSSTITPNSSRVVDCFGVGM